jgi:serine/threonine protein kinase
LDFLARGGQSDVFICKDEYDKEIKILKVYDDSKLTDRDKLPIVYKKLRQLKHPCILRIMNLVLEDPVCCVFHFVKGGTLFQKIHKGQMSFQDAGNYLAQIVNLIDFLHKNNVVHRDIKPENFLVDENNRLYLSDFDFACFEADSLRRYLLPKNIRTQGTSAFMAPEHLKGGVPTRAMDVYAVATTYYYMLTKKYPFGDDLSARFTLGRYIPAFMLNKFQNGVLRQALHPNPKQRIKSVMEFYRFLYG